MAAFLDLYGGYSTIDGLLEELRLFGVDIDKMKCNPFEFYTYLLWCCISAALALVGLLCVLTGGWARCRLFRLTVSVPCALYCPVLLGLLVACLGQRKTQEDGLSLVLFVLQPVVLLHLGLLVRDARRRGLDAKFFDLPLTRRQWRWLIFSVAFHLLVLLTAIIMLGYFNGPGRLLLALEASLTLRQVRPHPTVCPPGEMEMMPILFGICTLIAIGGHMSVCCTKAAAPYRRAWLLGVTAPTAASAVVLVVCFVTCLDTHASQELPLFICLDTISLVAAAFCTRCAAILVDHPTRWLYIALAPYHFMCVVAVTTCLIYHAVEKPLMALSFVETWEREPQPHSARFIFFTIIVLHVVGLQSIVLYDPDESDTTETVTAGHRADVDRRERLRLAAAKRRQRQGAAAAGSGRPSVRALMPTFLSRRVARLRRATATTTTRGPGGVELKTAANNADSLAHVGNSAPATVPPLPRPIRQDAAATTASAPAADSTTEWFL